MDRTLSSPLIDLKMPSPKIDAMVLCMDLSEEPSSFDQSSSMIKLNRNGSEVHISIEENLAQPLKIMASFDHQIFLNLAEGIKAQVILDVKPSCSLHVHLKSKTNLVLYFFLHENHQVPHNSRIDVDENAHLTIFDIGTFADQTDRSMEVFLAGEQARVVYFGLDQLNKNAKKTSKLTIYHRKPNTHSKQIFRGIYADAAQGTFFGKVIVDKQAFFCQAEQRYKSILLGKLAKAHVMPQLEINNSDIKASHGASIGELDHEALFYLCSRGLSKEDAKFLLIESLINDILHEINDLSLRHFLYCKLKKSIESSLGQGG